MARTNSLTIAFEYRARTLLGIGVLLVIVLVPFVTTAAAASGADARLRPGQMDALSFPSQMVSYQAVDCLTVNVCALTGIDRSTGRAVFAETTNHGESWSESLRLAGPSGEEFNAVDCMSAANCVLGGATNAPESAIVVKTTNGGRSWAVARLPEKVGPGNGILTIYCSRTHSCQAGGRYIRTVLVSSDSGGSWKTGATLPPNQNLVSIACTTAMDCLATGGTALRSTDGGRSWEDSGPALPDQAESIVCPNSHECIAVGVAHAWYSYDGGNIWNRAQIRDVHSEAELAFESVSCPTATDCIAVGSTVDDHNLVIDSADSGRTWDVNGQ
jgi:photosystem II stability/assembly factor-like uncharacterized protein